MDQNKYEHLFNECMIHVCFDSVDNYNHAVNQCMLSGAIPICVDKGPVLETVCPDGYFPILSTKKKIKHYTGSKHTFSEENLNDTIQKILGTSDTTWRLWVRTIKNTLLETKIWWMRSRRSFQGGVPPGSFHFKEEGGWNHRWVFA